MSGYSRSEARDWAREKLVGAVNCTIPSLTGDLRGINEAAIRHDIHRAKKHGFIGTLGVSEVSITLPEYLDFLRICKDEAGPGFYLGHHASWSTLEQSIEALAGAQRAGADLVLLSYPPISTRSRSRTSTNTPRRCATPRASGSSCSRRSCGDSAAASTPPTSRHG